MEATFSSTVLLALPKFCDGQEFNIMPQMTARSNDGKIYETVDIITLNCETKDDIVPHLEKMLETLHELPQNATVVHNIKIITKWLEEIRAGDYEHQVPPNLLEALRYTARQALTPEQMYYLSGVTRFMP